MLGLNLLVRLGRKVLAGPVADAGVFPTGYYRHLILAALEEDDFPRALRHLQWVKEPMLGQLVVLRLRLLAGRHRRQQQALAELLANGLAAARREACLELLRQEEQALKLLAGYESRALEVLGDRRWPETAALPS